jgi:hypothetical protein
VLGGLPSQCTEIQCSPLRLQESHCAPTKEQELQPLTEGKKEAIVTTKITQKGVTYAAYPYLRNSDRGPGGKKNPQKPTTGTQEIKRITKNNSRCINLNVE